MAKTKLQEAIRTYLDNESRHRDLVKNEVYTRWFVELKSAKTPKMEFRQKYLSCRSLFNYSHLIR